MIDFKKLSDELSELPFEADGADSGHVLLKDVKACAEEMLRGEQKFANSASLLWAIVDASNWERYRFNFTVAMISGKNLSKEPPEYLIDVLSNALLKGSSFEEVMLASRFNEHAEPTQDRIMRC